MSSFIDGGFIEGGPEPAASSAAVPSRREAAGEGQGGCTNNIPPSIHIETGGEDWLELSLYVRHHDFKNLEERLDEAKQAAEDSPDLRMYLLVGNWIASIHHLGATAGGKTNRIAYRWHIELEPGIDLLLMRRAEPHHSIPNAIARITSIALLRHGLAEAWARASTALAALGIEIERNKVSRVDPCIDLGGVPISAFYAAYHDGRYITRARKGTAYLKELEFEDHRNGRRPTGFRIGGGLLIRVYDKLEESRFQPEKLWLLQMRRYGEEVAAATRVEYQLRREALKRFGVDSLSDWIRLRGSVVHYLTHDWFRMTAIAVDLKNPKRTPLLPLWEETQGMFGEWAGKELLPLEPLPKNPVDIEQSMAQVIGQLNSILAKCGTTINGSFDYVSEAAKLLRASLVNRDIAEEVRLRALKLGVSGT